MKRVWVWSSLAVVLGLCGLIGGLALYRASLRPAMNVLFVTLDTTRADHLGCYGDTSALTPAIDALSKEGVQFERAYVTVPLTLPSHASMLTGLYPIENGIHDNLHNQLAPNIPTLASVLKKHGFETGAFMGSIVLHSKWGLNRGFDTYDDDMAGGEQHGDESHLCLLGNQVVDKAISWLEPRTKKPFFCWVHLFDPHAPFEGHAKEFGDRFQDRPYDGDIAFADMQVGRLVEFLRQKQVIDKTLIVIVGDHGEGLGDHQELEHGFLLHNPTVRTPLIFRATELCQAGYRVPTSVSLVDLFPTVLECLKIPNAIRTSGRSLKSALEGKEIPPRTCYSETNAAFLAFGWSPLKGVTTDSWRYVHSTREELYDLKDDPDEKVNLAESRPDEIQELRQVLADVEQEMVPCVEVKADLSEEERRKLGAIGYVSAKLRSINDGSPLSDVKDMIQYYNKEMQTRQLLMKGKAKEAEEILRTIVKEAPR
ncbi:MAG: hypothetical protein FJ267_08730, partial [Planctomycetes bacterium]|nr:hypothetical protein [Planctomycetota bacterium]